MRYGVSGPPAANRRTARRMRTAMKMSERYVGGRNRGPVSSCLTVMLCDAYGRSAAAGPHRSRGVLRATHLIMPSTLGHEGSDGASPAMAGRERLWLGSMTQDTLGASPATDELARLARGEHPDPHAILGAHQARGGTVIRAFHPFARFDLAGGGRFRRVR